MKNPQLQKIEQVFVEQVFALVVKYNAALYRRFPHNSPGFLNCQAKKLYRLLKNITRYNKI